MAEHNRAFIFIDGESANPDLSNDKLSASLDACPRCKDKQKIIFHARQRDREPPKQEAPFGIHIMKIRDE